MDKKTAVSRRLFQDSALPVTVPLETFNPFVPLDVDDFSLPVAIFKYGGKNHSKSTWL